jgi:prepilin-type N-terminal cleavage/methylation domain-containing protein
MRSRTGFTLIEMLAVLAVLAVPAGILLPVMLQARESARRATCLSNTRQIGLGLAMYQQDYDDVLMPWYVDVSSTPSGHRFDDIAVWVDLIQPYVKNGARIHLTNPKGEEPNGIFRCPSFNAEEYLKQGNKPDCGGPGFLDAWIPARQYWANYSIGFGRATTRHGTCTQADPYYLFAGNDVRYPPMQTLAEIRRPAETIILSDGFTGIIKFGPSFSTLFGCEAANAHQGGATHVFVDGHARWIAGNSERHLERAATGCWYKKYYAIDK